MFRFAQRKNILKSTSILMGVLVAGGAVSDAVSALTYQQDIGVSFTFNPSISVTLSSADLIIPNLAPGTASDSNIITVNVKTNNITGYTLNATVGDNTTFNTRDLVNQNSNVTDKFSSVAFGTIVANNTALNDNTWGYSYSLDNGSTWIANTASSTSAGYSGLPLYSDAVNVAKLKETTGPAATTAGDNIKFKIAARASNEIASGEYNNVINFTAVANPEPQPEPISCSGANKICYSPNSLGTVEGTMGEQSTDDSGNDLTGGSTVTLLASNFSQTGYGFAGWSDVPDYATNANAHFYGPQETITTPSDMSAGLPLYAVWVKSAGSMQANAASVCSGLTTAPTNGTANSSSVSALTDQRDNNTYAIAKLADGNCWMIENLRLDNSATLTTINTNNPLNDGTNVTLKHSYSDTETYNTLSASQDPTTTAWCNTNAASCDDQSMLFTGNTTNRASSPTANGVAMYSYGNYYNWYSATAGNGTYSFSTNNNSVAGDLCPTGWHLPIGGRKANVDVSDFWKLSRATIGADPANFANDYFYYTGTPEGTDASNKMRAYPNNFVYSGYVYSGSVGLRGSYGLYWSSTASSSSVAYYLHLDSSNVGPGTSYNYKYSGWTVRCVVSGV